MSNVPSNTNIVGFCSGGIVLERWGKSVVVKLPADAVASIQEACHAKLPTKNPQLRSTDRRMSEYDALHGLAVLRLTPEEAQNTRAALLNFVSRANVNGREEDVLRGIAQSLGDRLKDHDLYISDYRIPVYESPAPTLDQEPQSPTPHTCCSGGQGACSCKH